MILILPVQRKRGGSDLTNLILALVLEPSFQGHPEVASCEFNGNECGVKGIAVTTQQSRSTFLHSPWSFLGNALLSNDCFQPAKNELAYTRHANIIDSF